MSTESSEVEKENGRKKDVTIIVNGRPRVVEEKDVSFEEAVELAFGVKVNAVNTLTVHGKTKRRGRQRVDSTSRSRKKAIVTLKPGEKIELFAGV